MASASDFTDYYFDLGRRAKEFGETRDQQRLAAQRQLDVLQRGRRTDLILVGVVVCCAIWERWRRR